MKVDIRHMIEMPQGNLEVEPEGYEIEGKKVSEISITEWVDREKEAEMAETFEKMIAAVEP